MSSGSLVSSYINQGFAILPSHFSHGEMEGTAALVETIQRDPAALPEHLARKLVMERDLSSKQSGGLSSVDKGDAIFIIGDLPAFSPRFVSLMIEPRLIQAVQLLLGSDDLCYHFSNLTMKRGQLGSGINWHRDFPNRYLCPSRSSFLRVMICLDGMTAENGATEFIRGSHLISDSDARISKVSETVEGNSFQTISAKCPPGSLVFIHPKSIHGGPPNRSKGHRRNIIVQWGRCDDPIPKISQQDERLAGCSVEDIQSWVSRRGAISQHARA